MHPQNFIDARNFRLWQNLSGKFIIHLKGHCYAHCLVSLYEKNVTIFLPQQNESIESFTHELLHLHLFANGSSYAYQLKVRARVEPLLDWTFNENLFDQVGQSLEHYKMLPLLFKWDLKESYLMSHIILHAVLQ